MPSLHEICDVAEAWVKLKDGKTLTCLVNGAEPNYNKNTYESWCFWRGEIEKKIWRDLEKSGIAREDVFEIMHTNGMSGSVLYRVGGNDGNS